MISTLNTLYLIHIQFLSILPDTLRDLQIKLLIIDNLFYVCYRKTIIMQTESIKILKGLL